MFCHTNSSCLAWKFTPVENFVPRQRLQCLRHFQSLLLTTSAKYYWNCWGPGEEELLKFFINEIKTLNTELKESISIHYIKIYFKWWSPCNYVVIIKFLCWFFTHFQAQFYLKHFLQLWLFNICIGLWPYTMTWDTAATSLHPHQSGGSYLYWFITV